MPEVKEGLYRETPENCKGHVGSDLTGVAILAGWAVRDGGAGLLYPILKKEELPGYLYMINQGASMTWEYWLRERSKVRNCFSSIGV